jgi:hypothetical protein
MQSFPLNLQELLVDNFFQYIVNNNIRFEEDDIDTLVFLFAGMCNVEVYFYNLLMVYYPFRIKKIIIMDKSYSEENKSIIINKFQREGYFNYIGFINTINDGELNFDRMTEEHDVKVNKSLCLGFRPQIMKMVSDLTDYVQLINSFIFDWYQANMKKNVFLINENNIIHIEEFQHIQLIFKRLYNN